MRVSGGWRRFSASWNYAWDNLVPANQQFSFSVASAHPSCSLVSTISKYNSARRLMTVWLAWWPLCLHVAASRRTATVIRHGGVTYAGVYGHLNILHITTFQPWEAGACCCLYFILKKKAGEKDRIQRPKCKVTKAVRTRDTTLHILQLYLTMLDKVFMVSRYRNIQTTLVFGGMWHHFN